MTTPRKRRSFASGADLPAAFLPFLVCFLEPPVRAGDEFEGAMIGAAVEKSASLPNLC